MGIGLQVAITAAVSILSLGGQPPSEIRFSLRTDPKTLDPLLVAEEASETVRFLTGGVLIRLNRRTQQLDPELAVSWKVLEGGRRVDFILRRGVRFSDGGAFGPADVIATFQRINKPPGPSPIADAFLSGGREVRAEARGADTVSVSFAAPIAGVELLFDQLAITSARAVLPQNAVLGPFLVAEHKSGQFVLLRRNPHYWKEGRGGQRLPSVKSLRLDIQSNREIELVRFRRGELHFIDKLEPEAFARLRKEGPHAINAGASLDSEFFWFNQKPAAPIPAHKKAWFASRMFRQAMSRAINRDDIVRLVYRGYARPAAGPVSPANKVWFNSELKPARYDLERALKLLRGDGFQFDGRTLRDRAGNRVEFSLITNADSRTRARIGAMLQQDLAKIGVQIAFTPLEFRSVIERIAATQNYEACLLGLTNVEIDPNSQANVWSSSGTHHAWNPGQSKPATDWEAELDRLMQRQATATDVKTRKVAFDRVQQIVAEQVPIVYLVHPDVLVAVSPLVRNADPSALPPHLFWNVEHLSLSQQKGRDD